MAVPNQSHSHSKPLYGAMKYTYKSRLGQDENHLAKVACGRGFICFLTDRGIILTKGDPHSGCLGTVCIDLKSLAAFLSCALARLHQGRYIQVAPIGIENSNLSAMVGAVRCYLSIRPGLPQG